MTANTEREAFSERLQQALQRAGHSANSPTQLAHHFNLRFHGQSVTAHAARKWLVGEAIPTQEKIRTLAQWLSIPAEWLRFGETYDTSIVRAYCLAEEDSEMHVLPDWRLLDMHQRRLVQEFIQILLRTRQFSPPSADPSICDEGILRPDAKVAS